MFEPLVYDKMCIADHWGNSAGTIGHLYWIPTLCHIKINFRGKIINYKVLKRIQDLCELRREESLQQDTHSSNHKRLINLAALKLRMFNKRHHMESEEISHKLREPIAAFIIIWNNARTPTNQ